MICVSFVFPRLVSHKRKPGIKLSANSFVELGMLVRGIGILNGCRETGFRIMNLGSYDTVVIGELNVQRTENLVLGVGCGKYLLVNAFGIENVGIRVDPHSRTNAQSITIDDTSDG